MCIECNFNDWEYTVVINVKCFIVINWWQELYAFMYPVQYILMQYSYKLWMLHSTHSPEEESLCCELFCVRLAPVLLLFFHFLEINICHFVQYSCLLHLSNLSAKETRSHVFRDKNIPWNHVIHTCNFINVSMFVLLYM